MQMIPAPMTNFQDGAERRETNINGPYFSNFWSELGAC